MGDVDELTKEFLAESLEGLDRMDRCLTDLEQRPQDKDLLGEIFRSVHTIKGTTGFLGFKRLEKLAHAGENLLGLLRDGKLPADRSIITGLLQLLDGLRAILKIIEAEDGEGAGEDGALIRQLEELQAPVHAAAKTVVHAPAAPPVAAASPSRPAPPAEPDDHVAAAPAPSEPEAAKPRAQAASAAESTLRVDVALLNRMMNLVGEL